MVENQIIGNEFFRVENILIDLDVFFSFKKSTIFKTKTGMHWKYAKSWDKLWLTA